MTAAVLAEELGISERTLYRDIADLVAQGAPIQGEAGIGYVLRPGLFLPPLMFGADETEAIVLGLRYVDQRGDEVLSKAAAKALSKIEAMLPPAAQEELKNPAAMPGPAGRGFPTNAVDLAMLRTAIRAQAKLRIDYEDANGVRTKRIVWPIALGFTDEVRILAAWCEARAAYRSFRTDRMASAVETGERYSGRRGAMLKAWQAQMEPGEDSAFAPDKV